MISRNNRLKLDHRHWSLQRWDTHPQVYHLDLSLGIYHCKFLLREKECFSYYSSILAMMDNQGLPSPRVSHRVLYLRYSRIICVTFCERMRIFRPNVLLTGWRERVRGWPQRERRRILSERLNNATHSVCGWHGSRGRSELWVVASEAFPLSTSDAPPRHPVSLRLSPSPSSPHIGCRCRVHLLSSLHHSDPLSLSLFASEFPSSPSSSYFHHSSRERWFLDGPRQRTPASATSARSRVNLIR